MGGSTPGVHGITNAAIRPRRAFSLRRRSGTTHRLATVSMLHDMAAMSGVDGDEDAVAGLCGAGRCVNDLLCARCRFRDWTPDSGIRLYGFRVVVTLPA